MGNYRDHLTPRRFSVIPCGLVLISALLLTREADAFQVIGGNVTVVQGGTAILPCHIIDTNDDLTQITWQRRTREKPYNDNFLTIVPKNGPLFVNGGDDRFKYIGNFNAKNATLQLSNVALKDEGSYTCIFTLFPSGNQKTEIPLNLLVPPSTSVKDNLPTLGTEEVLFATCTAAGSKPPAEVRWLTGTLAEKVRTTKNSTQYDNGTTTTVSSLFGVPMREINRHLVQCVISGDSLSTEVILPFTIQVYFSPTEVNIRVISQDSFECVTEANPNAEFIWSRSGQSLPESAVKVEGAKLQLLSPTSDLNGLYQCEASNTYGRKHSQLYVHVASGFSPHMVTENLNQPGELKVMMNKSKKNCRERQRKLCDSCGRRWTTSGLKAPTTSFQSQLVNKQMNYRWRYLVSLYIHPSTSAHVIGREAGYTLNRSPACCRANTE